MRWLREPRSVRRRKVRLHRDVLFVRPRLRRVCGALWRWNVQRHRDVLDVRDRLRALHDDASLRRRDMQRHRDMLDVPGRLWRVPSALRRRSMQRCGDLRNLHVRLLRSMRNNVHVLLARHRLPERAVLRCATVRWGEGLLRQHDDGLRQHRRDTMPCDVCVQSVPERHGVWPLRRMQALRRRTPDLLAPMLYQCRLPSSAR